MKGFSFQPPDSNFKYLYGMDLERFRILSESRSAENKKFLLSLKKKDPRKIDDQFHTLHEEVFQEIDCLTCGNCCKTTSPIFYQTDIERVAKALRMKPGDFIEAYLQVDEDNDFVLKSSPCPFLDADNYCRVYADRPKACREYPHTNRTKMVPIMELTHKNTLVCPAVLEMVERLKVIRK
jgi:Fe-S-cluster containining protein